MQAASFGPCAIYTLLGSVLSDVRRLMSAVFAPMSIRLRLTLSYVLLLATILMAFGGGLYAILSYNLLTEVDQTLETRAQEVQNGATAALEVQSDPSIALFRGGFTLPSANTFATPNVYVQVIVLATGQTSRSQNLGDQTLTVSPTILGRVTAGVPVLTTITVQSVPIRLYARPLVWRDGTLGVIEVAQPLMGVYDTLRQLATLMAIGIVASLVVASALGAFLARGALAPIGRITTTAQSISRAGDLTRRLEQGKTQDEVGKLTATFNEMLGRIEELFRVQQEFVADVSHELRSPLTAIQGNLDLLRRGAEQNPEERQVALTAIRSESERMQRLVDDLLFLARADAGVQIQKRPVELDTVLLDVYRHARLVSSGVKVSLGAEDQAQVMGDPDRLKQLFLNLVDNAIKYTPGGGEVTLSLERDTQWVKVSVADTGVGIPSQDLPRIFDRFYRVDKARSREKGGTGLGLAIVKWIVDAHSGKIEVQSESGKGTKFTVWLPLMTGKGIGVS